VALVASGASFCVLSALAYQFSAWALFHSSFRFSRIAAGSIHVDVLVAGNSRARDLLQGGDLGRSPSVFNLAYNGLGRESTIEWIKIFFRRGNTANTLLIETSALYDNSSSCDNKPYWALYPELRAASGDGCAQDVTSARYFPLTVFNSEQYLRALYYLLLKPHGDQDWADDYDIPPQLCAHLPLENIFGFHKLAQQLDVDMVRAEIAELDAWLARNGYRTQLVFVQAPFFAAPRALPAIADMQRVDARVLGGERYLNLGSALGDACSDFADSEHIDVSGRRKVAAMLFQYLGFGASGAMTTFSRPN
jgi:hypothetical protein